MNFLKSGPELKLSELKVPTFLVDLYWDLRDRHLLPLLGLIVVAIVAVPFLLSGGSKSEPAAGTGALAAPPSPEASTASLTVVEAKPGLRDYRKRLRSDTPTDPFEQKYTGPVLTGTKLGGGESGSTSSTSTTSTSTSSTTITKTGGSGHSTSTEVTTETGGQPSSGGGETPPPGHLTLFAFAADVKTVRIHTEANGVTKTDDPIVRNRVLPPSALPTEKTQVVTYMGISPKTHLPLLLVSDAVTSVFGEAKCLSGAGTCQLVEVEPGFPTTFVLGEAGATRYKITILKIEPVAVARN